jgi:3-oxoadipate enol-lactonase
VEHRFGVGFVAVDRSGGSGVWSIDRPRVRPAGRFGAVPFAKVRDLDVYYEVHGNGPRVVLVSGTGGDLRTNPRRGHGPLERRCQVLMYDQRGLGQTSKPDRPCAMADFADDCLALMDVVGWDRAHVMGISFGGMVAQHVALRAPERVDRLVLACTSSGGAGGASFDLLSVADLPRAERARVTLPIMDTRNDPTTDPPTYAPMFDVIAPLMAAPPLNADDPAAAIGARRQLEARAGHDTWDRLGEIVADTLLIGGRYDGQAPPANMERLAERIPHSRLELFDGGHLFLLQDPSAWAAVVRFLVTD